MQQRRHRIDPVKDCASQQLQRPISGKATTRLRQSLVRRARLKLGFRASCALLERTSSKWTYRQLLGALSLISSSVPHTKKRVAVCLRRARRSGSAAPRQATGAEGAFRNSDSHVLLNRKSRRGPL